MNSKIGWFLTIVSLALAVCFSAQAEFSTQRVVLRSNTAEIVDLYAHRNLGAITITTNTALDDTSISVSAGHGAVVGNVICLKENSRYTQVRVLSTNATSIGIDTPLDYAYTTSASVHKGEHDMAVDASSSNIVYHISPPSGTVWHVTRVIFHIEDGTAMDDGTFGGIAALTKGVVVRISNGVKKNIFTIKTNGEFAERAYDREYPSKPPAGTGYAINVRRTFNGAEKNNTAIRLDGDDGDELQIILQDDLSALSHFHAVLQGYVYEQ